MNWVSRRDAGGGNYCPDSSVTREEMAVFIIAARFGAGASFTYSSTPSFADVPDSGATEPYFKFVQRMKQDGITAGCAKAVPRHPSTTAPSEAVTRAQMAVFMMAGLFNCLCRLTAPAITAISPPTLAAGTSGTFTITGVNTTFTQGTTTLSPIPGVTIGTITVNSPTSLTVQLTAAANATPRPYTRSRQSLTQNRMCCPIALLFSSAMRFPPCAAPLCSTRWPEGRGPNYAPVARSRHLAPQLPAARCPGRRTP